MSGLVVPAVTAAEAARMARAARREAVLAERGPAAWRMTGRTERPKKGKGAGYQRRSKHGRPLD